MQTQIEQHGAKSVDRKPRTAEKTAVIKGTFLPEKQKYFPDIPKKGSGKKEKKIPPDSGPQTVSAGRVRCFFSVEVWIFLHNKSLPRTECFIHNCPGL